MTLGLKTVIPVSFTDTSLPVLRDDPVLPAQGALMLLDPGHSVAIAKGQPSGAPALNQLFPNLAQSQAQSVLVTSSDLSGQIIQLDYNNGIGGASYGFCERTPKGGYHAAFTHRDYTLIESSKGFVVSIPTLIQNYFVSVPTNQFFVSLWSRETKVSPGTTNSAWATFLGKRTSITAGYAWAFADNGPPLTHGTGTASLGFHDDGNFLGNRRRSLGFKNYAQQPSWDGGPQGASFTVGSYGTENSYLDAKSNSAAQVFYRFYLEDLTVSGRTYDEVDALDAAAFTTAFAPGGRYYGDTVPTDPNTVV